MKNKGTVELFQEKDLAKKTVQKLIMDRNLSFINNFNVHIMHLKSISFTCSYVGKKKSKNSNFTRHDK